MTKDKLKVKQLFDSGKSKSEISKILNIPRTTVRRWISEQMVTPAFEVAHKPNAEPKREVKGFEEPTDETLKDLKQRISAIEKLLTDFKNELVAQKKSSQELVSKTKAETLSEVEIWFERYTLAPKPRAVKERFDAISNALKDKFEDHLRGYHGIY
jgi:transposase-like protein